MFAEIPKAMLARMRELEKTDQNDRADGTERMMRLRQIPPDTGRFIALLAANCPDGEFVEIGTSAGYSAMWISLALGRRRIKLKTFEVLPEKAALARDTFTLSGIQEKVDLVEGDFLLCGRDLGPIAFCFIDCEKHLYQACFDMVCDKVVSGGLIVADNATNHFDSLKGMMDGAVSDGRFDCVTVPIGKGEFLCRRK